MELEMKSIDTEKQIATAEKLLPRKDTRIPNFWCSKRFLVVTLLFFGNFNMVMQKVNINIAIVEMIAKKNTTTEDNTTISQAEFDWDSKTVGMIQSIFAYGYLFCIGGAYIVSKVGGAVACGGSLLIMSITTMLTPACLNISLYWFAGARVLLGVLDGFAYTSSAELLSRWAPVQERSTMMSMCFCGIYIGIAVTYPVCGFLADRWGWQMIFYVTGAICFIWSVIWLLLVKNQPSKDKWMSSEERLYIIENTETTPRKEVVHPYKAILRSPQVWALCAAKFTYSWGLTLLVTCFPLYVKDITQLSTEEVGFISSIPNFACIFMIPLAGTIMDCWQNRSNLKPTQIHKIMMSVGFISGSVLFVFASFSENFIVSMGCFILIKLMLSFNFLILQLVCIYMGPKHASFVAGISAFWYTVSTMILPTVVGFLVQHNSLEEWNRCFLLSGGVLLCGAVIFLMYGSSEPQPWSTSSPSYINKKANIENIIPCET
ncbi:sialin-like [Planococcus citri]|uniref:sialin-like n=1 Tax=Planococcus citri TaxID=170843 RepID=UPI0031F8B8E0